MKFKLDENLGILGKAVLEAHGHDVMTVGEQDLSGVADERLYQVVCQERRILVALDRDFGEVLRFPPEPTAGLVVLASPSRLSRAEILARIVDLCVMLRTEPVEGKLWIVEPGRIRIHQMRV